MSRWRAAWLTLGVTTLGGSVAVNAFRGDWVMVLLLGTALCINVRSMGREYARRDRTTR